MKNKKLKPPTPETDAFIERNIARGPTGWDWRVHSRRLERERDEAREQVQQISESNQVLMADVRFYRNAWEQLKDVAK